MRPIAYLISALQPPAAIMCCLVLCLASLGTVSQAQSQSAHPCKDVIMIARIVNAIAGISDLRKHGADWTSSIRRALSEGMCDQRN